MYFSCDNTLKFLSIISAGESGLGKTTFLNTLWNTTLAEDIQPRNLFASKTVEINPVPYGLS